ncbi:fungal-specific transcription factor domain-domain-containing protein [Kockovaella imperatae]|uniref:Fungal-specific transcription factor domain-domain-containing protein n=1 Tax=Kockovaella imperatae TaxID=4999 RepID=A0A1Y1U7N3_9TREE|nr:fungal-specific transcription factor domain-domain-containing protein [Kockovaella imperatae]ORX34040.1 fungal-specific transcription factor domain-domain-containing protein [Kockovaella imperatae]
MLPQRPGDDTNRYSLLSAGNKLAPLNLGNSSRSYMPPSPGNMPGGIGSGNGSGTGTGGGGGSSIAGGPGSSGDMGFWDRDKTRDARNQWSPGSSSISRASSRLPPMVHHGTGHSPSWESFPYRPISPRQSVLTPPMTSQQPHQQGHHHHQHQQQQQQHHHHPSQHQQHQQQHQQGFQRQHSHQSFHPREEESPTSPASTSVSGRRQSPDEASSKKKKRRVALSCAECAKRKQKCNRQTPCQHCVQRRVPELCVPYIREGSPPPRNRTKAAAAAAASAGGGGGGAGSGGAGQGGPDIKIEMAGSTAATSLNTAPTARQPSQLPTLTVRVARIEALLNAVVNRVDGVEGKALHDWRINHAPATSPPPLGSHAMSRSRNVSSNSNHGDTDREGSGDEVLKIDRESLSRNPLPQLMSNQPVNRTIDFHGTAQESFEKGMLSNGIEIHYVKRLLTDLPDRPTADKLVNQFFEKFNFVRYPIDEPSFRSSYDWLYENLQNLNPRSLLFLPVACIVIAIAYRIAPAELGFDEDTKKRESLKLYTNTRSAIFIARAITPVTLQLVETRILLGLYLILMHERRLSEGWAELRGAITSAQIIGLHRDGAVLGCDAYATEYRRRLWSYLLHADATYSCLLGRPTCIDLDSSDTLPPSNIDMSNNEGLKNLKPNETPSKPLQTSTFATYLILRRRLSEIVGEIARLFSRISNPIQYDEVKRIDGLFTQFMAELPPDFRMRNPDKSNDSQLWYLSIHRYYIQTEILHFRIILHRPYLLRRLRSSRYALSRSACFESAVLDFKIREAFKKDVPDFFETLLGGSFREFNAAMIAGISEILDPRSPHAADMRAIIQNFLDHFPHDETKDEFSQKEAGIVSEHRSAWGLWVKIYTLHRRAKEAEERRANRPRSSDARFSALRTFSAERDEPRGGEQPNGSGTNWPTTYNSGSHGSDDEGNDQPQQLLNHWLYHNQMVNPPMSFAPGELFPNPGYALDANTQTEGGVLSGWMGNPMDPALPQPSVDVPMDLNAQQGGNGAVPEMVGQVWGDGNNVQFWDKMIDGIQTAQGPTNFLMTGA